MLSGMTPELPPTPPGRWLPRLEAARRLGITERTLQRWMRDGRVMSRPVSGKHVQVYVPDHAVKRQDQKQDTAMTPHDGTLELTMLHTLRDLAAAQATVFAARTAAQEAIIRQQAEEIGTLKAQLAAQATPWWRGLWARLAGR